MIPETYVNRVLQYARQGYDSIEFPTYDTDWDSEAYISVSGQNSNNSVRVTDAFLRAVREDGDWALLRRTDGKVAKTLKARELWDQVGHPASSSTTPSTPGTPARPTARSGARTPARNTCSSMTPPATSPR
jgi:ribonucleoside-diphosphate reductase alpha chain